MNYNLDRYIKAQQYTYQNAVAELQAGRKRTHWMWFVFPQLIGLGRSQRAIDYAIRSLEEAEAYLHHPILGSRLIELSNLLLKYESKEIKEVFGSPDDLKLHSCMTLFSFASSSEVNIFQMVLDKCFDGKPDNGTITLLK